MGMFDELTCDYPLPEVGVVNWKFQTKDLGCDLAHYHITTDGELQLWVHGWLDDFKDVLPIPVQLHGEPYHGYLTFHDFRDEIWYDFRAKFTDGKLIRIDAIEIRDTNYQPDTQDSD